VDNDLPTRGGRGAAAPDLRSVENAAVASNKLLRLVAVQVLNLFRDRSLPRELKLLLIPLIFMVPLYSLTILIFLGDFAFCMIKDGHEIKFYYYLIFLGVTAPGTFAILLIYAVMSDKYLSTQDLDQQLERVTSNRQSRRRHPARANV
jgi:hypothetical protein